MAIDPVRYESQYSPGYRLWRKRLWRRRARPVFFVVIVLGVSISPFSCPGIREALHNAWQAQRLLHYRMPPEKVVYEEDPEKIRPLLGELTPEQGADLADPRQTYVYSDTTNYIRGTADRPHAEHYPPIYQEMFPISGSRAMAFAHGRVSASGRQRIVIVSCARIRDPAGVRVSAISRPPDRNYILLTNKGGILDLPVERGQLARVYAGRPDPNDDAYFTIKYEIDGVSGLVAGRLEDDDNVTLRILSGPSATQPEPAPSNEQ